MSDVKQGPPLHISPGVFLLGAKACKVFAYLISKHNINVCLSRAPLYHLKCNETGPVSYTTAVPTTMV